MFIYTKLFKGVRFLVNFYSFKKKCTYRNCTALFHYDVNCVRTSVASKLGRRKANWRYLMIPSVHESVLVLLCERGWNPNNYIWHVGFARGSGVLPEYSKFCPVQAYNWEKQIFRHKVGQTLHDSFINFYYPLKKTSHKQEICFQKCLLLEKKMHIWLVVSI